MRNDDLGSQIARAGWTGLAVLIIGVVVLGSIFAAIAAGVKGIAILVGVVLVFVVITPAEHRHYDRRDGLSGGDSERRDA